MKRMERGWIKKEGESTSVGLLAISAMICRRHYFTARAR